MRRVLAAALSAGLLLAACKSQINPHRSPEADADLLVALSAGGAGTAGGDGMPAPQQKIVLSINNYPGADQPLEQDLVQREFELFEKKNPDIRIEYSTWKFTPESFFERARNRMLTDIIEVSAAQAPAIIDLNYAADIRPDIAGQPAFRELNPEVLSFLMRDGRIYGIPVELNTMALFFNRHLYAQVNAAEPMPRPVEAKKGKGAEGEPKEDLYAPTPRPSFEVAQARRYRNSYYDSQAQSAEQADEEQPRTYSRRGEEDVRDYYQLQQTPAPRRRWPFGSYYDTPQYNQAQPFWRRQRPTPQPEEVETPAPRLRPAPDGDTGPPDIADPDAQPTPGVGTKTRRSIDEDILTTSQETQMASVTPAPRTRETTTVRTSNLPRDWESFVKAAVRLTNHSAGVYGYAPVIFAEGGGREFSQWGIQAGLRIAYPEGERIALDVNSRAAADVAQFMKDLTWRYDVTPPLDKCYADNVIRMFAEGRVAMTMLPANRDTIRRLLRLGMPLDAIGIAPLPAGPKGRKHLTFGRCLMVNPQLDKDKRAAAVKWLLFQLDPETIRMREQFYYREQEMTGAPRVPLFLRARREAMAVALKPYRTLPTYADYEDAIAPLLQPEPGYFTEQLYSAIADGVRPVVTRKDSDPVAEIGSVGLEFERKFLRDAPTPKGLQRYLQRFVELAGR